MYLSFAERRHKDQRYDEQQHYEHREYPADSRVFIGCDEVIAAVDKRGQQQRHSAAGPERLSKPAPSQRFAMPYHAPMNTPKQACPGTAVTARTSAAPKQYIAT